MKIEHCSCGGRAKIAYAKKMIRIRCENCGHTLYYSDHHGEKEEPSENGLEKVVEFWNGECIIDE